MQNVAVTISGKTYQRAQANARLLNKPVEEVINEVLERGLNTVSETTDLNQVPAEMANELSAMRQLSDETLFHLARGWFPQDKQKQMDKLFHKRSAGELDATGLATLEALVAEGGRHTLRRGEAMALLVARGYDKSEILPEAKKR
jgi:ABC-type xylose transport system substrate-binding protein